MAEACEGLRDKLVRQWLGPVEPAEWNPKCELVLHPTEAAYLREVGSGSRNTVASSLIDSKQGRISLRRIDVLATKPGWERASLAHELMHVVLADCFSGKQLPRWIDEGVAVLADPLEKQERHLRDLRTAMASRSEFRLMELLTLSDYPASRRWGTFYGQSASLVRYLLDQATTEQFVEFVQLAQSQGYEHGLRHVYGIGIAELEHRWRATVKAENRLKSAPPTPPSRSNAPIASLLTQPVSTASSDQATSLAGR